MENTISHYRIIEKLGAGGMGEVYLAEDLKLGRKVALKLLGEEFTTNRDRLHRFEQEASAASSLNHPNILTIYELGVDDGRHFMATEFIDGHTLRHRLADDSLSTVQILDIAVQIAGALDEAHGAGIIHRDIKPENVMIRRNGFVKLLDFGLAKLTERTIDRSSLDAEASTRVFVQTDAGVVMGTSHYMSPEQARAQTVDARTDIWSLGVVMYEMVAGRAPFLGENSTDVLVGITQKEPPPLARFASAVPAEFEWIITKALRKDRDERYQTAKEILTDLKKLKQRLEFEAELERSTPPGQSSFSTISDHGGLPTSVIPVTTAQATAAPHHVSSAEYIVSEIKKRKRSVGIAAVALLLAVGAGIFFYFNRANALTDKDTILLADFVNTTGEPVFDGTLKQALAVQLGQTPFLNILPDERVRQTLRFMGRSPDDRITRDVGIEICRRQGIKALLVGSISSLGSHYVISLEALNAQTGDTIARDQVEAESKEKVLSSLSQSAWRLREKLGESLSMMNQFAKPIDQATTSSLEALKAYATGNELRTAGRSGDAVAFFKRAIELDPNFAMAYARLAVHHGNFGELDLAQQYAQKAYDLRDRVSEAERFYIEEKYHSYITGDLDKGIEVLRAWAKTYPNDYIPHNNLAFRYSLIGMEEEALKEALEAYKLDPRGNTARTNVIEAFLKLGRVDEAMQHYKELQAQNPDSDSVHFFGYMIAFLKNDDAGMEREIAWAAGKGRESDYLMAHAFVAVQRGQLRKAEELGARAAEILKKEDRKESLGQVLADMAALEYLMGDCKKAQVNAAAGLAAFRGRISLPNAASTFAGCGDTARAQSLLDELTRLYPQDTIAVAIDGPFVKAQIERQRKNLAEAQRLMETTRRYDFGSVAGFRHSYLRGVIYLEQQNAVEAAKEFQSILDRRDRDPISPLYSFAHLGVARAAAMSGDLGKSRTHYQDFLALWKAADADSPVLAQVKKEYEALGK
jgi:eukaryotic-like serine/threonine-protein kinase